LTIISFRSFSTQTSLQEFPSTKSNRRATQDIHTTSLSGPVDNLTAAYKVLSFFADISFNQLVISAALNSFFRSSIVDHENNSLKTINRLSTPTG
jgi:hypothetical protein